MLVLALCLVVILSTCGRRCRGKTARFLESNPWLVVMCALVLLDTCVVVAEILLELNAMRSQSAAAACLHCLCVHVVHVTKIHDRRCHAVYLRLNKMLEIS